jgi:hypothetical protein
VVVLLAIIVRIMSPGDMRGRSKTIITAH